MKPIAGALIACLAVAAAASAQPLLFDRTDYASNTGARAIVSADFDGNGWIDIAQANTGRNSVTVLLNHVNGRAGLVRSYEVTVGTGPFAIASADFNRDNVPDLAVANADNDSITVLFGRAGGGVASQLTLAAPGNPRGITAADMNRDGKPDIVYTAYLQKAVRILLGNGTGGFTAGASSSPENAQPQGVVAADFNRDGFVDVAVAYTNATGLAILFGNAQGGFSGGLTTNPTVASINVLAAADLNHDGWLDIVAASTIGNKVAVYLGSEFGWPLHATYATGASPRGVALADLNQDGNIDIAAANRSGNSVSILLGRTSLPGSFLNAMTTAAGAGSRGVVAADFNQDGRLDLATGNELAATATVLTNRIDLAPAAFAFDREPVNATIDGWNTIAAADFNRNGLLDLVLPGLVVLDGGTATIPLPGNGIGEYATGDFNRDGRPDIVRSNYVDQTLELLRGDGAGGFTRIWTTPLIVGMLLTADLNRDAIPDLVVSAFVPGESFPVVKTYLGNGNGTFRSSAQTSMAITTSVISLGDANNDGKIDVIGLRSVFEGESNAVIFYGDGSGGFAAVAEYPISIAFLNTAKVADFNHDGRADLIASGTDHFEIKLGKAGGGFGPSATFAATNIPARFASPFVFEIVDLNQDGNLDLVYASVLLGNGDGTFTPSEFDVPPDGKLFADYNSDGTVDIIASTYTSAVILHNRRTQTNRPPIIDAAHDLTVPYVWEFENDEEEQCGFCVSAHDDDLHALAYEWTNASGKTLGFGPLFVPRDLLPGAYPLTVVVSDGRGGEARRTVTFTVTPFKEVVMDVYGDCCGAWRTVSDDDAGGLRMQHPDGGAPKVVTALANPANYFDVEFTADPTQEYKVWVRMKAQNDNWANDSIHLQFEGAVNGAGTPVYRIGTTSSLEINLEECSGCGLAGWGWRDERWGPSLHAAPVLLRFPDGGRQRLRVQTREDGVSIDEIVLSSDLYRSAAPGPPKRDSTWLRATSYPYF